MSNAATIARNAVFLSIGEIGARILSFLLVVAIARQLGAGGLGAFAFAFALADLLLNFSDMGVTTYLTKEMAKKKEEIGSYVGNAFGMRLLLAPAVLVLGGSVAAVAFALHSITAETFLLTLLVALGTAINFLTDPLRMVFLSQERDEYYAAITILERLVFAGAGLLLLLNGKGLILVVGMFVVSQLISFAATACLVRKKFVKFGFKLEKAKIKSVLTGSVAFGIANFFRMVYQRADTILLGIMSGFAVTGWYGAALRITESLRFLPVVVITAVFPAMSRWHTQSKENFKLLYEKTFYYVLLAAFPMAVGLTATADRVITFFYGSAFTGSIIVLKLLAWAEALLFIQYLMGYMLNAVDKQKIFTLITAAYAIGNVLLNLFLIPRYGHLGAATAALVTQIIAVSLLYHYCNKHGYAISMLKLAYKPAIASIVMAVAIYFMSGVYLLLAVPIASAVYLAALVAVRGIGKEELMLIRRLV